MAVGTELNQGRNKYFVDPVSPWTEAADSMLKDYYLPGVRDLLNNKKILSRYIRTNTEDVSGKEAVLAINTGRNQGIGYIADQGKLPDPGKQQYRRATYKIQQFYGRIYFSGPAQAASRNDRGSWIRVLDSEIRGLARDMQVERNRIHFGDGSGRLARLASEAGAPKTYTLDRPGGFGGNLGRGTQYLANGMRVAVIRTDGATLAWATINAKRAFYITNINHAAGTVQFEEDLESGAASLTGATTTGEWFLVRASETSSTIEAGDTGFLNEPWGLAAIVDDANPFAGINAALSGASGDTYRFLGGIDATVVDLWRAYVIDNGGIPVPFNQDMFAQANDGLDMSGDGNVELWITTHGIRRQYANALVAQRRFVGTMKLDGGYKALEYNETPIVVDKDCTRGRIYGLDLKTIMLFLSVDYHWMDADGSMLQRMADKDAYQATLLRYDQLGTDARNRNVLIRDIIDN